MMMMGIRIKEMAIKGVNLRSKDKSVAKIRLLVGPAKEMRAESFLGFLRLKGSKGTGFPQPKRKKTSMRVPMGSRWAKGLRLILPNNLAVGSPSLSDTQAWADS